MTTLRFWPHLAICGTGLCARVTDFFTFCLLHAATSFSLLTWRSFFKLMKMADSFPDRVIRGKFHCKVFVRKAVLQSHFFACPSYLFHISAACNLISNTQCMSNWLSIYISVTVAKGPDISSSKSQRPSVIKKSMPYSKLDIHCVSEIKLRTLVIVH